MIQKLKNWFKQRQRKAEEQRRLRQYKSYHEMVALEREAHIDEYLSRLRKNLLQKGPTVWDVLEGRVPPYTRKERVALAIHDVLSFIEIDPKTGRLVWKV